MKDDKPIPMYQLYINRETGIVDGFLVPAKRQYIKSNWQAEVKHTP